jgi:23S rRNA pseudouridine2457 synthase
MLILLNKPFGLLSQFTPRDGHPGLSQVISAPGCRPAGRLDHDSEGLLVLTDERALASALAQPARHWPKTYLAQVEGSPDDAAIAALLRGPQLADGPSAPLGVRRVPEPPWLWPRTPSIRVRASIPTAWIEIILSEGRNRQVRRMTAAVGHPTLRLIRIAIGPLRLDALAPGEHRHCGADELRAVRAYRPAVATNARVSRPRRAARST